ncbi:MAG: hypothetical protein V8T86_09260 [Victivallis sp.]
MPAIKCPFCSREIPERKQKTLTGRVRCPGCGSIGPLSELAALGEGRLPKGVTERENGTVLHVNCFSAWSLPAAAAVPVALLFFIAGLRNGGIHGIVFVLFVVILLLSVWRPLFGSLEIRRIPGAFVFRRGLWRKELPLDRLRLFKLARVCCRNGSSYHIGCMRKGGRTICIGAGLPLVRLAAAVEWMERRLYDSGRENGKNMAPLAKNEAEILSKLSEVTSWKDESE